MSNRKPRHVLDPEWEETLRRGHEADQGVGSVERELEVVHLLRHLREPEPLDDARFESILSEVGDAVYGTSAVGGRMAWLRKRWYVWVTPLAAAAAVVLIVVAPPGAPGSGEGQIARTESSEERKAESAVADAEAPAGAAAAAPRLALAERSAQAEALEKQFEILEAKARAEVDDSVERGRSQGRSGLFDVAKSAGPGQPPATTRPSTDPPAAEAKAAETQARPNAGATAAPPATKPAKPAEPATKADAYDGGTP